MCEIKQLWISVLFFFLKVKSCRINQLFNLNFKSLYLYLEEDLSVSLNFILLLDGDLQLF